MDARDDVVFEDDPPIDPIGLDQPNSPQKDDIKRVFHPHSERSTMNMSFDDYRTSQVLPKRRTLLDKECTSPFRTRLDFELAELAQDAMLNKNQTGRLIALIHRCAENPQGFTLRNHSDLEYMWELASKKCTEFERFDIVVPYKDQVRSFEMYARPLWNWALDLVQDPQLADFFVWDAEKDYIFNGTKYVRFYTEPWTAEAMWDIQSKLPKSIENKLCPFILYADKAKLSSFGTQKGYPVVARLANVAVGLRNSRDWGGGQIVGWLPVVDEDQAETGKPGFVNFKNAVWHKSFYKLLESIVAISKTGAWTQCGDGLLRCLFPMILILVSDYEEACVMTLIRGLRALYPCPICYVKKDDQSNLAEFAPLRTSLEAQEIVHEARTLYADEREDLLKEHGLRNVDNVFWEPAYSDPHQAASFEHLHSYSGGLWGRHLFEQVKKHVERFAGRQAAKIDHLVSKFPRWRNLNHFDSIMSTAFNDGSKHEDVSKIIILVSHYVLVEEIDVLLLQICRSYQELSLYITMKLQTADRIADGREELQNFGRLCSDSAESELLTKNWNFPKMHAHQHAFDDIQRKGAARNFGTKIDEAMHGSARNAYLRQTNFKNVAPQILKSEHRTLVAKYMRDQLNDTDQAQHKDPEGQDNDRDPEDTEEQQANVALGAKQRPIRFVDLENAMKADGAFDRFRIKLSHFLTQFLPTYGHSLPNGKAVSFKSQDQIMPYRFLKVFYQSLDDWSDEADFLRCSPSFHGRSRFDGALVLTATGNIFVKLIYVFQVALDGKNYPFALVQPLDAPLGRILAKDKVLKLFRVRAKPRQAAEFISVHSIVRGAVLVPDSERDGDYFIMDVVEGDMFLRMKDMYKQRFE
ncbi:hypothetical protein C8F04DRAFT_950739 [Mycena alexandri]|uniref:Uncharacterized protein n=1 Tax=Mycena alexandri TaxID=1745969 RepID=A0AAD6X8J8_9AGAR|nr:hypothetical protein C8F04DRAFT_950739 [Mycena alexandri]